MSSVCPIRLGRLAASSTAVPPPNHVWPSLLAFAFALGCGARSENPAPPKASTPEPDAAEPSGQSTLSDAAAPVFECLHDEGQDGESVCETLWREASCEWNAAVAAANGCKLDSDCIDLDIESRCFPCSSLLFVSKAGSTAFQASLAALEQGTCSEIALGCGLADVDCAGSVPSAPGCRDGICGPLRGCDASVYAATRQIERARAELAESCNVDADCRVEWLAPCEWGCPLPLVVAAGSRFDLASAIETLCAQTPEVETCAPSACDTATPISAVCNAGKCELSL